MIIEQATVQDAAEILALQKLAYLSEAAIYDDYTIPPLTQTLEEIAEDLELDHCSHGRGICQYRNWKHES